MVRYQAARDEDSALAAVLIDRRVLDSALDPSVPAGDAPAAELVDALRNGEFHLRYQPIVAPHALRQGDAAGAVRQPGRGR